LLSFEKLYRLKTPDVKPTWIVLEKCFDNLELEVYLVPENKAVIGIGN
jgi:hypothetical protein